MKKLIYFGDPMCSWCWGLSHHLKRLIAHYNGRLDFEIVMGGLRPGGGDPWTEDFRNMLRTHWEHVSEASGQPFNYDFFEREHFDYNTEPPARAVRVIRDLAPTQELEFYEFIQSAFYVENLDPGLPEFYRAPCLTLGIEHPEFEVRFNSDQYKLLIRKDFTRAQQIGVRGFPSILLQIEDKIHVVTLGYAEFTQMQGVIDKLIN